MCRLLLLAACATFFVNEARAQTIYDCFYKDENGIIKVTDSREKIPVALRERAICEPARRKGQVRPNAVELQGNIRSVDMASPLGRIALRWPRALEKVYGRTPERALADAAKTASRALRSGGFPTYISTVELTLRVVFLDRNMPEKQIPMNMVTSCHPGWMYPPADIFIVGQNVVEGCGNSAPPSSADADKALAKVLLHEIGHAVEAAILRDTVQRPDGSRAEGFASWFEGYASRYSSIIPNDESRISYANLGLAGIKYGLTGHSFSGSPLDYGLSFLYFQMLSERRGVSGLMRFYQSRIMKGEGFAQAFRAEVGLNEQNIRENLIKTAEEIVNKNKRNQRGR